MPWRTEPRRCRLVGGANGTRASGIPCGANRKRIGTAKLGNRDERDQLPAIGPELAVSGSDSAVPLSQDPRKRGCFWDGRWSRPQSLCSRRLVGGAGSPGRTRLSLLSREDTGNSAGFGAIAGRRGSEKRPVPGHLRRNFPGPWSRERPPGEQGNLSAGGAGERETQEGPWAGPLRCSVPRTSRRTGVKESRAAAAIAPMRSRNRRGRRWAEHWG